MVRIQLLAAIVFACLTGCATHTSPLPTSQPIHFSSQTGPLRVAVIGMSHGHVDGILGYAMRHPNDVQIVGVYEPNRARFDKLAAKYKLDPSLYHDKLDPMLDETKPEAASVMTSIADHLMAVEACAPRGIHVMVEKPLAFSNDDARRIAELSRKYGVLVMTNYEPSWYASVREAKRMVDSGEMSPIRRMIFRHGHSGPIEIGCAPEFLAWLTDPKQNGGGALVDFGCYGAILSTWLMDGQRPTHIVASAATLRPNEYPHVDDDATIVLTYPTATAVIEASWDWTHDNKEMDLYTEKGSIHAGKWNDLSIRDPNKPPQSITPPKMPPDLENTWIYFRKVVRGQCAVDPMSSLEMNLTVVEILDAARNQVGEGSTTAK